MAVPSSSSQVTSLLKMLCRHVVGDEASASVIAKAVEIVASFPRSPSTSISDENMRAETVFDRIESALASTASSPQLTVVQAHRAKLMSAGTSGSSMADFRFKGSLMSLLALVSGLLRRSLTRRGLGAGSETVSDMHLTRAAANMTRAALHTMPGLLDDAGSPDQSPVTAVVRTAASVTSASTGSFRDDGDKVPRRDPVDVAQIGMPQYPFSIPAVSASIRPHTSTDYLRGVDAGQMPQEDEAKLVKDLVFVLQGISGEFVKFDEESDHFKLGVQLHSQEAAIFVGHGQASIALAIAKCGWLYRRVSELLRAPKLDEAAAPPPQASLVNQAFHAAIRVEMDEFYRKLALLDADIASSQGTGVEITLTPKPHKWTLIRLLAWSEEPIALLQLLAVVMEAVHGKIGGALLSAVYSMWYSGDPLTKQVLGRVLAKSSVPFISMVKEFVLTGELKQGSVAVLSDDSVHHLDTAALALTAELFIAHRPSASMDDLWLEKFYVLREQVPCFIPADLVDCIIDSGKAVHFIRTVCDDHEWVLQHTTAAVKALALAGIPIPRSDTSRAAITLPLASRQAIEVERLDYGHLDALEGADVVGVHAIEALVAVVQPLVNTRLLTLLFSNHHLLGHLRAIQRYVLLTQGDFVSILISSVHTELDKPATSLAITRHSLEALVEGAIRASNAQFEEKEVLRRLNVKLLKPSPDELGWDVFLLHYELPPAVRAVMTNTSQESYSMIFHFLWRIKRVEHALCMIWSAQMTASHSLRSQKHAGLNGVLHMCHLLRTDMTNFTTNLVSYLNFEVLAPAWQNFAAEAVRVPTIGALLELHARYVSGMIDKSLLSDRTKMIALPLQAILTDALRFCKLQQGIVDAALEQVAARKMAEIEMAQRTSSGAWGLPVGVEDMDALDDRISEALNEVVTAFGPRIAAIAREYRAKVTALLQGMETAAFTDGLEELRSLVLRFDYNEFYASIG